MENFNEFMEIFMTGDYFLVFLVLMLMIFVVLIMALIKTRMQYLEIVNMEKNKPKEISINDKVVKSKVDDNIEKIDEDSDILDD